SYKSRCRAAPVGAALAAKGWEPHDKSVAAKAPPTKAGAARDLWERLQPRKGGSRTIKASRLKPLPEKACRAEAGALQPQLLGAALVALGEAGVGRQAVAAFAIQVGQLAGRQRVA